MGDDFSDYPESIAELKNTGFSKNITPREALISMLRKIDNKEIDPETLIVMYSRHDENGDLFSNYKASGKTLDLYGLVAMTQWAILHDGANEDDE